MNKLTLPILLIVTAAHGISGTGNTTLIETNNNRKQEVIKNIQKDWVNGLLIGKDMSMISQSYANQIAELSSQKTHRSVYVDNDIQQNFKEQYDIYIGDIDKILSLEGEKAEVKWQNKVSYLSQSYKQAHDAQKKLLKQLHKKKQFLIDKKSSQKKIDFLQKLIDQTSSLLNDSTRQKLSRSSNKFETFDDWKKFLIQQKSIQTGNNKSNNKSTTRNQQKILRNNALPYSGRNYSSPPLLYSPTISPSYADQTVQAGTTDDLKETEIVSFSSEINQLASDLNYDYIKILNYVRQNIALEIYAKGQKGASATLLTKAGNDVDQASLLIALLRKSNIPSRFVHGIIRQPIDEALSNMGLSNPNQVLNALNKAGIAYDPIIEGGQVRAIQRQYTWVSAYVPYAQYRGSASDLSDKTWVPMAPAIKENSIQSSDYQYSNSGIDADNLVIDFLTTAQNQSPLLMWKNLVQTDISNNYTINYTDLLNRQLNETPLYPFIPASLPYKVIVVNSESAQLSSEYMQTVTLQIGDSAQYLDVTLKLPEIAGKRLSLSYLPATVDDMNIINQAGGMALVEPYLVDLRPILKLDGKQINSINSSLPMASYENLKITFNGPSTPETFNRTTLIGNYLSLVVTSQNDQFPLDSEDPNIFADETKPVRIMHNLAKNYNQKWYEAENEIAAVMDVALIKPIPALTIVSPEFNLQQNAGLITKMTFKGISIDAVTHSVDAISRRSNNQDEYDFYRISSLQGSYLESDIFNSQWAIDAVSADQGIRRLADTNNLMQLDASNYQAQLSSSNHPQFIKDEIGNWINQGYEALLMPVTDNIETWSGSSWHIFDPQTGHSGYFISGIYAGGQTTQNPNDWANPSIFDEPYSEGENNDPLAGTSIEIIQSTNNQEDIVNNDLPKPLAVIVKDIYNNPVRDGIVTFTLEHGEGLLFDINDPSIKSVSLTSSTNSLGVAEIGFTLVDKINSYHLILQNPEDAHFTKIGAASINASVNSHFGIISTEDMFEAYAFPDEAVEIVVTSPCDHDPMQECLDDEGYAGSKGQVRHFRVVDQYGNSVSNVPINITSEPDFSTTKSKASNTSKGVKSQNTNSQQLPASLPPNLSSITKNSNNNSLNDVPDYGDRFYDTRPHNSKGKIVMKDDNCFSDMSIHPPDCAQESIDTHSDYYWSTFIPYHPSYSESANSIIIYFTFELILTNSELPELRLLNSVINDSDEMTGLKLLTSNYIGPYGKYEAGRASDTVAVPRKYIWGIAAYLTEFTLYDFWGLLSNVLTSLTYSDFLTAIPAFHDFDTHVFTLSQIPARYDFAYNWILCTTPGGNHTGLGTGPGSVCAMPEAFEIGNWTINDYMYVADINIVDIHPLVNGSHSQVTNSPLVIEAEISPGNFRPENIVLKIYRNGLLFHESKEEYPEYGSYSYLFNPDDRDNNIYEAEVTMNQGNRFEMTSAKRRVEEFSEQIVRRICSTSNDGAFSGQTACHDIVNLQTSGSIRIETNMYLNDDFVCRKEGFTIELNDEADVLIEVELRDSQGGPTGFITTLHDGILPEGTSNIIVTADQIGSGTHYLKITATSVETGETEIIESFLHSVIKKIDNLSIGHPIIKGVDLATSSMVYSKKDISLSAPGSDLEFIHTYSQDSHLELGPMGYGWTHNYMSRVIETKDCADVIIVTGTDGGTTRFWKQNGEIVPMRGYHSKLIKNLDGSYSFYSKNGTHYHYILQQDNVWWNDYIEDPNGNRLTIELEHNPGFAPIILSVTDSTNRKLIYHYETRTIRRRTGKVLIGISGPDGKEYTMNYTSNGHLAYVKMDCDAGLPCAANESYEYSNSPVEFVLDHTSNILETVTDNITGATRQYNYEDMAMNYIVGGAEVQNGLLERKVKSIDEDDAGTTDFTFTPTNKFNSSATVNQNGNISTYTMNHYGAATHITAPNGNKSMVWEISDEILLTSETDENGRTKTFTYDQFANLTSETIGSLTKSYTYEPPTNTPPYIIDRVKAYTDFKGATTTYTYDNKGNKILESLDGIEISYNYNAKGLVTSIEDGNGNTQIFDYDEYGQLISQTDGAGNTTTMIWDALGRKTSETDANGNTTLYEYDDLNRVTSKTLEDGLNGLENRIWHYTYENGGLTKIETDPNGHSTTYEYDKMGRLLKITNAQSATFTYIYDENGNKLSENDFNGNITNFAYDNANRLITKTEPLGKVTTYTYDNVGNVLTETTADRKATYGYSPERYFLTSFTGDGPSEGESRSAGTKNNRAGEPATDAITIRTVDGEGNILTETDPNGNLTTFSYDAHNRLITEVGVLGSGRTMVYDNNGNILSETTLNTTGNQVRTFIYDGANRRIASTNAEGEITTNTFDGNGNILTQSMPLGKQTAFAYNNLNLVTSKTEANETPALWTYVYDLTGNLITEYQPNGNIITTVYDELNRPLRKTDSIGLLAQTTYDNNSNVLTEIDGNGNINTHTYNDLNQRTSTTMPLGRSHTYTYTPFGEILTDTGPNGTITYTYNTLGQRATASGPDGYSETYKYDVNDNLTSYTDSRGNKTTYQVNALNQTTSQTTGAFTQTMFYDSLGNKLTETDYRGIVSAYTFDKENRQLTFSRAGQLQQTTVYNTAGLPQSVTDANGNTSTHSYNNQYYKTQTNLPETQVIKFTPNAFGDITFQDNPGQNDTTNVYDKRRRLISSTNGAGEQTQYEYDLNNNRTAVIKPDNTRYEYTFDAANRLTEITNTAENITTSYGYSNKDNLTSITDAENKVTNFTFDNRNRKLSKTYPDGQTVNYSYDNNGNLKTVSLPNGVGITYDYDVLNRKTSESYTGTYGSGTTTFTLDANGNPTNINENYGTLNFQTTMDYDNLDRMTSKTDVYGNSFVFQYDNNGNRKTFKDHENNLTNYEYDGLNRLDKLTHAGLGTFNWTFNNAGLTNKIDYPNGAKVEYDYDNANRISTIENKKSGADISKHVYTYDQNGNRKTMRETNIHTNQLITYEYDKADRLTSVEYPNNNKTTYVMDKVGNRTSEIITGTNPKTKTYGYNNRDQLTSITDTLGSNTSYTFDDAGNQLSKNENGVLTTFNYTARQRVKDITIGAGNPISYQYDYSGQRVNHQSNGMEKRFLYDGLTLIAETNTIGNTLARYHYGDRYQLAETRNSTNSYFHVDSMGTNVAVTNQDGSIQARYEYDAYGNLLTQAGSSPQPFGFTGHQFDEDTGLYYANARYYDATTARFNREDPLAGNQQTPPSLHRYLYANANPTVFVDPDGKQTTALDVHTRIRTEEDVARVVAESDERVANRKAIRERKAYIKTEENENLMYVSESKNNKVLLKNNVSRLDTVKKAHIAACVYNPECNAISTDIGDITRVSRSELRKIFDISEDELLDENTGFKAGLFRDNNTNELIFATAGTDGPDIPDNLTNLIQGAGILESQYMKVIDLALRIRKKASNINQPLSFTGHSLGGGLASLAALVTNNKATTFNAAGLHRNYKYLYSKLVQYDEPENSFEYNNPQFIKPKSRNQKQLINAIYVQGEVLSAIQDYTPLTSAAGNRIELQRGSTDGFLKQHGSNNVCMALGSYCDYSEGGKRGYESALYYKYAE